MKTVMDAEAYILFYVRVKKGRQPNRNAPHTVTRSGKVMICLTHNYVMIIVGCYVTSYKRLVFDHNLKLSARCLSFR